MEHIADRLKSRTPVRADHRERIRLLLRGQSLQRPLTLGRCEALALQVPQLRADVVIVRSKLRLQPHLLDVLHRPTVIVVDADGARFRISAVLERRADRLHAAARNVLRFDDRHVVTAVLQLQGCSEPGQSGAEHDDSLAAECRQLGRGSGAAGHRKQGKERSSIDVMGHELLFPRVQAAFSNRTRLARTCIRRDVHPTFVGCVCRLAL